MTKKDQFWDLIETSSFHVDIKGIEDNIQHTSRQQPTTTTTTTTTTAVVVPVVVVAVVVFQEKRGMEVSRAVYTYCKQKEFGKTII